MGFEDAGNVILKTKDYNALNFAYFWQKKVSDGLSLWIRNTAINFVFILFKLFNVVY